MKNIKLKTSEISPEQPYILDQPDTVYLLDNQVSFNFGGFAVNAPNVTLDLQGHTVWFGKVGAVKIPSLKVPKVAGKPWTTSFSTVISYSHTYAAVITPTFNGDYRENFSITIVDKQGKQIGYAKSDNPERGFAAAAVFRLDNPDSITVKIDSDGPGLLDCVICPLSYAIYAANQWLGDVIGGQDYDRRLKANNFTLRNGKIKQATPTLYRPTGVYASFIDNLNIEDIGFLTGGIDSTSVIAEGATGKVKINNCNTWETGRIIVNRMHIVASFSFNNSPSDIEITK